MPEKQFHSFTLLYLLFTNIHVFFYIYFQSQIIMIKTHLNTKVLSSRRQI